MPNPADAHDLLHAARLIRRMGGHPGLVARLEARAGIDLLGAQDGPEEQEPASPADPDHDLLAAAHGGGAATMADLLPLITSTGIGRRRWPTLNTYEQAGAIIGKWLVRAPWPRQKIHNRWVYSVPYGVGMK